jgi:flagellar motility protein MotE (MotC chaperone)
MIRSFWFTAIVAVVLGAGTCAGVLLLRWNDLVAPKKSVEAETKRFLTAKERGWDFWSNEIDTLSAELKKERLDLETRRRDLDAYALRLEAEKKELVRVRDEVQAMRTEISQKIPVLQASEKVNLKTLSRTYSTMKPRQAVAIISEMDDANAVKILALMKPDVVGAILQEMATPVQGVPSLANRAAKLSDDLRLLKLEEKTQTP